MSLIAIYLELERMGFKVSDRLLYRMLPPLISSLILRSAVCSSRQVWYDNRASDLTKEGMLSGIERAAAFILFLSADVLNRPFCQMEIRHALALKKPTVLLHGKSENEHKRTRRQHADDSPIARLCPRL